MLLVILMLVTGCSQVSIEPKAIDPTLDACPICWMSIIDQRFAGQIIDETGFTESFDDIGCLVLYLKRLEAQSQQGTILATYVKDFSTTEWIAAEDGFYVQGRIDTPMSFGIVAFSSKEAAEELAERIDGEIILWEEVKAVNFDIGFDAEPLGEQNEGELRQ